MEDRVNNYDPQDPGAGTTPGGSPNAGNGMNGNGAPGPGGNYNNGNMYRPPQGRPPKKNHTAVIVIAVIMALLLGFLMFIGFIGRIFTTAVGTLGTTGTASEEDVLNFSSPYIAELTVSGVIQGDSGSLYDDATYHHAWTLQKIKQLQEDSLNQGLILFVNTPGGGVYESDEIYLALQEYKKKTGRPVYSYMASQATSGGYYISAPADKIIANRNCWTGSIGVTLGTMYDISGFLKKHGVKTVTIDSGANKSMGSMTEELTKEQKEILQSLVDEAYDQFTGIVAKGRKMDLKKVKKLADGRIYTAKQAKENGLIDEVGTHESAVNDMKKKFELDGAELQRIDYPESDSFLRTLLDSIAASKKSSMENEIGQLKALMDGNKKFTVAYISEIQK